MEVVTLISTTKKKSARPFQIWTYFILDFNELIFLYICELAGITVTHSIVIQHKCGDIPQCRTRRRPYETSTKCFRTKNVDNFRQLSSAEPIRTNQWLNNCRFFIFFLFFRKVGEKKFTDCEVHLGSLYFSGAPTENFVAFHLTEKFWQDYTVR